ncbi:MAG: rubrerythrin family protein [Myxococcota bacterium]
MAPPLKGSKTEDNLKMAFSGESEASCRFLFFAKMAEAEGHPTAVAVFKETAAGETGHAHGHLEFLREICDPRLGIPIANTREALVASAALETYEFTEMYPGWARVARDEGYDEIAEWFETLARAERSHADRFQKGLENLK